MTLWLITSVLLIILCSALAAWCFKECEKKKHSAIGGLTYTYTGILCMYGAGTMIIIDILLFL